MLLVLNMGDCLVAGQGSFDQMVVRASGWPASRTRAVGVYLDEPLPDPREASGVIVTGSAAMVTDRAEWSERCGRWLVEALEAEVPIFGICYGHQLLADALGGRVGRNPGGREMGTVEVTLDRAALEQGDAEAARLFGGFSRPLVVQSSHLESVLEPPPGARVLGGSAKDPCQVMAIGPRCHTVQFHPEWDAVVTRGYIARRGALLAGEGVDAGELASQTRDSSDGATLLSRFVAALE